MDERTKAIDSAVRNFASAWQTATAAYDAGVAAERERCTTALRIAREGYASEAATGLAVLPQWRERTIALIDEALRA